MKDPPPCGGSDGRGAPAPIIRHLGRLDYEQALTAMRDFTSARGATTPDEIWLVEHGPVFTLGLAARTEHLHATDGIQGIHGIHGTGQIPVIRTERGGQVTYHGPGQVLAYLLLDLRRRGLMVRDLVCRIEAAAIDCLAEAGVIGLRKPGAPGIYVADDQGRPGAKIVALGLKISRGCSYHGLALNVDMDLSPFDAIDPCGYPGLPVTDLRRAIGGQAPLASGLSIDEWGRRLAARLVHHLA